MCRLLAFEVENGGDVLKSDYISFFYIGDDVASIVFVYELQTSLQSIAGCFLPC